MSDTRRDPGPAAEKSISPATATIVSVQLTPTHDGEAALVAELVYPGGGCTRVQIDGHTTAEIMVRANARELSELIGMPWTVLLPPR